MKVGDLVLYIEDHGISNPYASFVGKTALIIDARGEYLRVQWLDQSIAKWSDFNKRRFILVSGAKTNG